MVLTLCYSLPELHRWRPIATHAMIVTDAIGLVSADGLIRLALDHVIEHTWAIGAFRYSRPVIYDVRNAVALLVDYLKEEFDDSELYKAITKDAHFNGCPTLDSDLYGQRYYLNIIGQSINDNYTGYHRHRQDDKPPRLRRYRSDLR